MSWVLPCGAGGWLPMHLNSSSPPTQSVFPSHTLRSSMHAPPLHMNCLGPHTGGAAIATASGHRTDSERCFCCKGAKNWRAKCSSTRCGGVRNWCCKNCDLITRKLSNSSVRAAHTTHSQTLLLPLTRCGIPADGSEANAST